MSIGSVARCTSNNPHQAFMVSLLFLPAWTLASVYPYQKKIKSSLAIVLRPQRATRLIEALHILEHDPYHLHHSKTKTPTMTNDNISPQRLLPNPSPLHPQPQPQSPRNNNTPTHITQKQPYPTPPSPSPSRARAHYLKQNTLISIPPFLPQTEIRLLGHDTKAAAGGLI